MESQGPETWLALFRLVYVFQVPREEEGVLKRSQLVDLTDSYATRSGPGLGEIICAWLAHNLLHGGSTSRMRRLSVERRTAPAQTRSYWPGCVKSHTGRRAGASEQQLPDSALRLTPTTSFPQHHNAAPHFVMNFPSSGAQS